MDYTFSLPDWIKDYTTSDDTNHRSQRATQNTGIIPVSIFFSPQFTLNLVGADSDFMSQIKTIQQSTKTYDFFVIKTL